jgi:hypothetical protein
MSMISWPLETTAPGSTCQAATMPSCIAKPHLGMTMAWIRVAAHSAALAIPAPMTAWTAASILAGLGT